MTSATVVLTSPKVAYLPGLAMRRIADLDTQLSDRMDELTADHAHRPGFDTDE